MRVAAQLVAALGAQHDLADVEVEKPDGKADDDDDDQPGQEAGVRHGKRDPEDAGADDEPDEGGDAPQHLFFYHGIFSAGALI